MQPLPAGPFGAIVADPPWSFNDRGTRLAPGYAGDQRKGSRHYGVLSLDEICDLRIEEIAAPDCFLFLWIPAALRESPCFRLMWHEPRPDANDAMDAVWTYAQRVAARDVANYEAVDAMHGYHVAVMDAWGFTPTGAEFVWVKGRIEKSQLIKQIGGGHTVRNAHETCIICRRGKPERLDAGVASVILAPRTTHSTKPEAFYHAVEKLCAGPYLDLFGRRARARWTVWGDQAPQTEVVGP